MSLRRTALQRRTPIARSPMPARTRELKARAPKRAAARRDTGPTRETRAQVAARAGWRCEVCGRHVLNGDRSFHHRRPRGAGGTKRTDTNSAANLLLVCGSATSPDGCHLRIETRRSWARARGYLVAQVADPTTVAVQLASGRLVHLTHDGTYQEAAA